MSFRGKRKFEAAMNTAESYEQWKEAAQGYDTATGMDRWRARDQSTQFDNVAIRIRLDRLRSMRARHDHRGLLFNLAEQYNWVEEERQPVARDFIKLVRRRYQ